MATYALGVSAVLLAIVMGTLVNGLTAFFVPMETAEGWARAEIAGINACGLLGLAIGSVTTGFMASRLGMRLTGIISACAVGGCLIAASQATSVWTLYALFLLAGAIGGGLLFAPVFAYVGNWFPKAPGIAIGIAAAGQAIGQGGIPLLAAFLIESLGWRGAMLTLGLGTVAVLVPAASFLREAPPQPASSLPSGGIPPAAAIPLLSLAVFFCCACMAVPLMHLMPLIESFCIPPTQAGGVMLAMLLAAVVGRVAYGKLCDSIGAIRSWMIASLLQTLGVLAFTQFGTLRAFGLFGIVYGFAYAGVMTSLLVTARELTPSRNKATWMGIVLSFAWLGHAVGGLQSAWLFDLTAGFGAGFALGAAAGVGNLAVVGILLWLKHRADDRSGFLLRHPQAVA